MPITRTIKKWSSWLVDVWAMSCDQVHKVSLVVKEYVTSAGQQRGRMSEKRKAQVFPFVDIALWLFITLPLTNASRGRSLLKIGASYRKTEIHNGPKQTESPVSNLSIDSDILRNLDFTSLIKEFPVVGRSPEIRGRGSYGELTLVSVSLLF